MVWTAAQTRIAFDCPTLVQRLNAHYHTRMAAPLELPPTTPATMQSALGRDPNLDIPECKPGPQMARGQHMLLHWILQHSGTAVRTRNGGLMGQGELNPNMAGYLEGALQSLTQRNFLIHKPTQNRYTLSPKGHAYCNTYPVQKPYLGVRHGRVLPHPAAE